MAPDRNKERIPPAFALLHCAVLIVSKLVFGTRVTETSLEAENAAFAVVPGEVRGSWDAKQ